ncbi:unnamed protein product [Musa textilis]
MEHPLLANPPTTVPNSRPPPAKSSNPNILVGLTIFLVVAAFSLLANYEAAKGFQIVVVNAALQTRAGRRFDLLFVSNGRATRLVVASSNLVQRILYPDDSFPRKPVDRVTLYMAGEDLDRHGCSPRWTQRGRVRRPDEPGRDGGGRRQSGRGCGGATGHSAGLVMGWARRGPEVAS